MKPFKLLSIILLLIIGCTKDKRIIEFENILGKDNSETLTYLVSDFENNLLKNHYPSLDTKEAYQKFLTEILDGKIDNRWQLSDESKNRFEESRLKSEVYSFPDSIWIERDTSKIIFKRSFTPILKKRYKFLKTDGSFEHKISEHYISNSEVTDEIIIEKEMKVAEINRNGKFWVALSSVKEQDAFLNEYISVKNNIDFIDHEIMAEQLLNYELDYTDYFIKRVIVIEFLY